MIISVFAKPGSAKGPLVHEVDGKFTVFLREKAVGGAANKALIAEIAKHFDVAKTRVRVVSGATSRHKRIEIID